MNKSSPLADFLSAFAASTTEKYRCGSGERQLCEMRGINTFDFARNGQLCEMRGINTFDFARNGRLGEMRGISTFDFARNGQLGEMRGISTFDFARNGRLGANEFPFFQLELP
ncbi:hypothetical protein [Paenibacillus jilunlii]|uniref:hypothetical protein n=1 Tax=Paenibacillus jilunlii TaxID=682956 RepID=UPI000A838771|nr:hypothetical protein [Paenibacillus jilunlii]